MIIAEPLSHSDTAAIAQTREDWLTALNSDDVDGMIAPLSDDCIVFPPNEAPAVGRDASRTWHQGRVEHFTTHLTITTDEVLGGGLWAFDRFSYTIRLTPREGGSAIQTSGTCLWMWQRQSDGRWKIARALWNSSDPATGTSSDADVLAIRQVADDYTAAINAGDLVAFMSTCTPDIVFLPPDDVAVPGAEAVQRYVKNSFLDPFNVHLSFAFDDLQVTGDSAFGHGPYELRLTPKSGGDVIADGGKFLDVFKRQSGGSWKFARVMFNRNRGSSAS
jgi:ketosteroid isomerase-like protein